MGQPVSPSFLAGVRRRPVGQRDCASSCSGGSGVRCRVIGCVWWIWRCRGFPWSLYDPYWSPPCIIERYCYVVCRSNRTFYIAGVPSQATLARLLRLRHYFCNWAFSWRVTTQVWTLFAFLCLLSVRLRGEADSSTMLSFASSRKALLGNRKSRAGIQSSHLCLPRRQRNCRYFVRWSWYPGLVASVCWRIWTGRGTQPRSFSDWPPSWYSWTADHMYCPIEHIQFRLRFRQPKPLPWHKSIPSQRTIAFINASTLL